MDLFTIARQELRETEVFVDDIGFQSANLIVAAQMATQVVEELNANHLWLVQDMTVVQNSPIIPPPTQTHLPLITGENPINLDIVPMFVTM